MRDRIFLQWLAQRLICVYGESPNVDFVRKLQAIALTTPKDRDTRAGFSQFEEHTDNE